MEQQQSLFPSGYLTYGYKEKLPAKRGTLSTKCFTCSSSHPPSFKPQEEFCSGCCGLFLFPPPHKVGARCCCKSQEGNSPSQHRQHPEPGSQFLIPRAGGAPGAEISAALSLLLGPDRHQPCCT